MKKHSRRQRAQRGAQRGAQESRPLAEGKVPWERIAAMLPLVDELPADVLLGPGHGEDAALVRTAGGELWAVASDPITFASADAGQLVVLVNANDVAVRGATPRFFTASVLPARACRRQ